MAAVIRAAHSRQAVTSWVEHAGPVLVAHDLELAARLWQGDI